MAGRRIGYAQAIIMVAGFVLTMGYLLIYLAAVARYLKNSAWSEAEFHAAYRPHQWALFIGIALCSVAWIWALTSSVKMMRSSTQPTHGLS